MDVLGDGGIWSLAFAAGFATLVFAAIIQSSSGLGFGLIAAPVLLLIDAKFVPGTVIVLGTMVSFLSAARDVRHINRAYVAAGIAGRLPAAIVAASLLASISEALFQIIFACLILFAVALSLAGPAFRPSVRSMAMAGVISGLMGTLTSVGSPPFALALQNAPPKEMRATMNAVLLLGACVSMGSLAVFGSFGLGDVVRGIALMPAVLLGFWLARFIIADPRSEPWVRQTIYALCVLASLALLIRASGWLA